MGKPKRLDHFERIVDEKKLGNEYAGYFFRPEQVVKLLRAEHAWKTQMVKTLLKDSQSRQHGYNRFVAGQIDALQFVLMQLAKRKG